MRYAPRIQDLVLGFETSLLLLRLKWRTIRAKKAKLLLLAGLSILLLAIVIASNTGNLLKTVAQGGGETAAQQYAINYLTSFARGEIGTAGSVILGLSLLSALIAPFTGATTTSLLSQRDIVAFNATRWHRFTDSIIGQVFSSISVLQLVALTSITSLLTLQGGRGWGMLFTWAVWGVLVMIAVFATWVSEANGKMGVKGTLFILSVLSIGAGVAVLLDPEGIQDLFGLGTQYAYLVQNLGTQGDYLLLAQAFGIVLLTGFIVFYGTATLSSYVLAHSGKKYRKVQHKTKAKTKKVWLKKTFANPAIELMKVLSLSLLRSKSTRKPLIAVIVLGAGLVYFAEGEQVIATAFTVMIPLVVALAWGTNVFGILGGGMLWLLSKPKLAKHMPWFIFFVQIFYTSMLFITTWLPNTILGKVELAELPGILLAAAATTVLVSRSSVNKSVLHPHPTDFGTRNDAPLPPTTALSYTFRFALWAGQYGVIVLSIDDLFSQVALTFLAIVWSILRMTRLQSKWEDPATKANIVRVVSQD